MKLSFSIRNWNDLSWNDLCEVAAGTRMSGIELYDINGPVFQGKSSPVNPELAAQTRRRLVGDGLQVPCISTAADFTAPEFLTEFSECLRAAVNLGIPYIGIHTPGSARTGFPKFCRFSEMSRPPSSSKPHTPAPIRPACVIC